MTTEYKFGTAWHRVDSKTNSVNYSGVPLSDLDFSDWFMDFDEDMNVYLHVRHVDGQRRHRVYPRKDSCMRIAQKNGRLYWLRSYTKKSSQK